MYGHPLGTSDVCTGWGVGPKADVVTSKEGCMDLYCKSEPNVDKGGGGPKPQKSCGRA